MKKYERLYRYLSRNRYLRLAGDSYHKKDASATFIFEEASGLAQLMKMPNLPTLRYLVDENALVFAKIILSFYRRLDE